MFINFLIRYFKGNIRFKAYNGFGERLINLCAQNNIELWAFEKTEDGFIATVTSKSFKKVVSLAKKSNVEIGLVSKTGFWFQAGKYKKRWGLMLGVVAFFVFLFTMQNMVLKIEITGNETVKNSVIEAELSELGVRKLAFIPNLDLRQKKQQAMLRLPQLSWLTINRQGSTLFVHVTERKLKPEIEEKTPCDIVASKTGMIVYMEVYSGTKIVSEKHTVTKGEVIVSSAVNLQTGTEKEQKGTPVYVHADAKVIAQTQFQKNLSVDIKQLSKAYTGKKATRRYLSVFSLKLPLFVATKQSGLYDVCATEKPVYIFGIKTPFSLYSLEYKFYEEKPENLTLEEARRIINQAFEKYQATDLRDVAILSKTPHESRSNGVLTIKMDYIAEENIAVKKAVSSQE